MATSLKFLSRAVNQTQHVVAHSPMSQSPLRAGQRLLSDASSKTPKTAVASPSPATPIGGPSRFAEFFEDFDRTSKSTAEVVCSTCASPHFTQHKKQVLDGTSLRTAASLRAAASKAAQQELAASALSAAELCRQSFLAKRRCAGHPPGMSAVEGPLPCLLGRAVDASSESASHRQMMSELPVLLGRAHPEASKGDHCARVVSSRESAELARRAFLERQGRIAGRGLVKVP